MYDDGSVYMPLIHLTTHTFLSTLESTMDCWTDGRTDMFVCISLFIAVVSCSDGNTNGSQKVFHFGLFFSYTMATNDDDSVAGSCSTKMAHG